MSTLRYSLVVPVFNEVAALPGVVAEITKAMTSLGGDYECIVVDDGSTDGTAEMLERLARNQSSRIRPIHFVSNRGQGAALYAGLIHAQGQIVITLDGDQQNCPADIPRLVDTLEREGLDLVCGRRVERQDSWLRRTMSRLANGLRAWVLGDHVHDAGCGLKVMRRSVVPSLLPLRTLYSFIPALAVGAGFAVGEQVVSHRARYGGRSNYGLRAFFWRPFVDMLGVRWYQRRTVLRREDIVGAEEPNERVLEESGRVLDRLRPPRNPRSA